jgi:exopolyphosphatase/guanosine-5'-triphosphate,3'-diphosphate pyrophosphatase
VIVAAVDIGTNTTRLLVTDGERELHRDLAYTWLGEDLRATGRLSDASIARTCEALAAFRAEAAEHGAERVRAVATSAARDASNTEDLLDAAEAALGARPEVISGDAEARLSFRGAVSGLDAADGPWCVVDIGGGSTELVTGSTEVEGATSIDVGSGRLTREELPSDPPKPEELSNALAVVADLLDDAVREVPAVTSSRLVGVGGTITTVAAVELGLDPYDRDAVHHFVLTKDAAEDVFRTLATERLADRVHNPGLARERASVIVGGCCVLVALLRKLKAHEMLVSERDMLDGVALELLARGAR